MKTIFFVINLIKISIIGFFQVIYRFYLFLKETFLFYVLTEKLFIISTLGMIFFLIQGWRSYIIQFGIEKDKSHAIYTDDFLLFVIFILISLIPSLFILFRIKLSKNYFISLFTVRVFGLAGISYLYYLNFSYPERIAPLEHADYTFYFYSFLVCLISACINGFLGLINQAQKS
ncbi:MAG: hypothetical protein OEZ22_03135 [Spirochaetia bacterium]|nr:hypothetical protein [Spirochaetia bacterium]